LTQDPLTQELIAELKGWRDEILAHNPRYTMNIGRKSYTAKEIVEHIEQDTPDGRVLVNMLAKYSINRFKNFVNNGV